MSLSLNFDPQPEAVVLFVLSKRSTGGTVELALQWARCLRSVNVDTHFCSLTAPTDRDSPAINQIEAEFGPITSLDYSGRASALSCVRALRTVIRQSTPIAIQTFLSLADFYGSIAAVGTGRPVIGAIVSAQPGQSPIRTHRWLSHHPILRIAAGPSVRLALGQTVAERAIAAGMDSDSVRVVAPGVDLGRPPTSWPEHEDEAKDKDDEHTINVLAVGRLVDSKDYPTLVRAIAQLDGSIHLSIAGTGPAEGRIRSTAAALGVADRVHLLGRRSDVPDLLRWSDVYASATLLEGLVGYATLEAVMAEVPVVVSRIPEVTELLDEESVLLAEPGSPASFAEAIREAAREGQGIRTRHARRVVSEFFRPDRIGSELRDTYFGGPGRG